MFSKHIEESNLSIHRPDLKNKKVSLRIIFILYEKILSKMSPFLKEELIQSLFQHFAQNDMYREANMKQKFMSLVAV